VSETETVAPAEDGREGGPRAEGAAGDPDGVGGAEAPLFEGQAEREQPRALVAVFAAARYFGGGLAALFLAGIIYAIFRYPSATLVNGWIGAFVAFAAIGGALRALARDRGDPPRSPARVRADAEGLTCNEVLLAWRGSILRGTAARLPRGGARAWIVARTPLGFEEDFRFLVRTEEDAHRLLEACGVGPTQRSFSFRAAPPGGSLAWPFFVASSMVCATAVSAAAGVWAAAPVVPVLFALAIIAVFMAALRYARTEVEIGVDGVKLSGDVNAFIGRNEIESVEVGPDRPMRSGALTLKTKGGATFVIRPPARARFGTRDLAGIADRIAQIRALPPSGAHLREVRGLLARGERSVWEWLASVRALGAGRADYRTTPFEADDLAALATDGALSPEVRVAAALALKSSPAPDAAERVRVAAAACVSSRVRVCLESIAEDENEQEVAGRVAALKE
jgi:hypothetical protein